jgi:hypothetical protein
MTGRGGAAEMLLAREGGEILELLDDHGRMLPALTL